MEKKILYSGIMLDDLSVSKIINKFIIPDGWIRVKNLHCTICLGSLPEDWKSRIDENVTLLITEYGFDPDNKALALKVDNFKRIVNGESHITIATNPENFGKPKDSNNIIDWRKLSKKLTLTGTIQEVTN